MNEETRCVIAGAGPGGSMLALLLARRGVPVTLLEMHKDFDREFRGDTVHPSTLEILGSLPVMQLTIFRLSSASPTEKPADFGVGWIFR
jgi:2-polyprenyl-6-methoxyphenol hydroxylase-like FAD-dependent oxidoreductase